MTNLDTTPSVTSAEQRLKALGIELPVPPEPFGTYAEAVQTGNLLFLTGVLPTEGRRATFTGREMSRINRKSLMAPRSCFNRSSEGRKTLLDWCMASRASRSALP